MLRKNVAGQFLYIVAVKASDGTALTGATISGYRSIDGAAQAAITGTITELANGQYKVALSQADTNGNNIGFLFTATSMIPVGYTVITTAADPTDAVRFGLTALPNANAGANGGLPTGDANARVAVQVGTGAGQINSSGGKVPATLASTDVTGNVAADVQTIKTQAVTCAAGVTVLASVGTAATSTAQTGDSYARLGAPAGASVSADIAAVNAKTTNLPAAPASTTNITAGTITTVTNLTNAPTAGDFTATMKTSLNAATPSVTVSDKTGFSLSAAGVQAIWDALTSALTTVGSIGKLLVTNIDAAISSRSTYAGGAVASVTAAVTVGTNNDKTGYALTSAYDPAKTAAQPSDVPTAAANATALLDSTDAIETGWTPRKALRIILAALGGKLSGAATTTVTVRNATDTTDRITATVDASGNRTAVTLNGN